MKILFLDVFILLSILLSIVCAESYVIQPQTWEYKGHEIAFEISHPVNCDNDSSEKMTESEKIPILLLNGFGVGSFHQHRLIPELVVPKDNDENIDKDIKMDDQMVYCIDYLGQGASWPRNCEDGFSENERELSYSADTWMDQIIRFIEEVIRNEKVHVVGNSVGGYLAAHLAHRRPDLVESVCLLNPTPVWGLNLPGWSGHLPPPKIPKAIGRFLFDKIRELGTIEKYLDAAYSRKEAFDETLVGRHTILIVVLCVLTHYVVYYPILTIAVIL